ncbi:MAG TPA: LysM peptidoglycan-binding domain-containing protein [Phycisphaerae bacterium]|nr:LysM peptidoglycan-binding domain-containing protein [Phycisphaerae bacterium]
MGRETKFGLLVGLVFIVLFGVILSGRAGLSMSDHAVLPTGESTKYRTTAEALSRNVDPFLVQTPLVVGGTGSSAVAQASSSAVVQDTAAAVEEPLPAPATLAVSPEATKPDDVGTVAFGPAVVETPMAASPAVAREPATDRPAVESSPVEAAETSRPVYTVRAGDTLVAIARKHYGNDGERLWKNIYEANRQVLRDPNRLAAGQKLVIPQVAPPAASTATAALAAATEPSTRDVTADDLGRMLGTQSDLVEQPARAPATYTVQPGDTFYGIAKKLYGDSRYARLLHLKNRHLVPEANKLRVGQQIVLLDGVNNDTTVALR